ncbi:HEAT repeat domain-containing protein [Reyranella sp.]|uniref:HEAT repeat domain-containing protein n=1 Tax=Reyranella sp. TaxID=1929291 RepID=UPI003D144799
MPLIRRPSPPSEPSAATPASLTEGTSDQRWAAVRAAAAQPGSIALLAAALTQERDPRVLEAIFTGLARAGTAESATAVVPFIRSEDASLRAAALDALRAMPEASRPHVARLLADPDADVRLLSCELARGMPESEANRLLSDLLVRETEKNVAAAAVEVLAEIGRPEALPALTRCAERFADDSFLAFSIKVATDRIGSP